MTYVRPDRAVAALCLSAFIGLALLVAPSASYGQGVQRIAAIVNEDVISAYELNQRVLLVLVTGRIPDSPENRRRLRSQILRNMIDEQLQLQEAKRLNISVSKEEIDQLLARLNEQNNLPPGSLETVLERANVDVNMLRQKIRAEESWKKVLRNRIQQQVFISDEEVEEELQRLIEARNLPRQRVAEIFLPIDNPDNERQVFEVANRLMQQIRAGGNFQALAREFSQSASAAVGGDLGWITEGQLDPAIDRTLSGMSKGEVAGPTRTLSGFYILLLIDRVMPSGTGDGDVAVDFTQLVIPLPPDASAEDIQKEQQVAAEIRAGVNSCEDMRAAAASMEAPKSGDVKDARLSALPAAIRAPLSRLKIGETTDPIRVTDGLFLATLCDKAGGTDDLPTAAEVRRRLGNARFNLLIRRYMRDLRQTAFVDIRG